MVIIDSSGPSWADIMTAFGTVGAVVAAVGIAITSSRKTNQVTAAERVEADRRLREQLDHSDQQLRTQQQHSEQQLRAQQEHSDQQLEAERAAADRRLQEQFRKAEELHQRSQAAAVEVLGLRMTPGPGVVSTPEDPAGRPAIIVVNKGKYAITNIDVRLSPDGASVIPLGNRNNLLDLHSLPEDWMEDMVGVMGGVYLGTIVPGAAMLFVGDAVLVRTLRTSFPMVRWKDHWGDGWEYKKGEVYESDMGVDWRPSG